MECGGPLDERPGPWRRLPRLRVYFDKGSAYRQKGNASRQTRWRPQRAGADRDGAAVRQMEVVGVRVEMPTNNPIVLLKETDGERYLPIWIGPERGNRHRLRPAGHGSARPLTHDLMRDMLEALEIRLTTVNITALRDGIFFADLIFSNGREVSARPSDSIALALRTGASIFVRRRDSRRGGGRDPGRAGGRGREVPRVPGHHHARGLRPGCEA